MKVGVVSDLHLGSKSTRKSGSSIVYPSKALSYFERAVQQMKAQGVDLIVALGDLAQDNSKKNYPKLKKVEQKYGIKVLWLMGNHDNAGNFKKYFGSDDYIYEQGGIKFHVKNVICNDSQNCLRGDLGGDIILQHYPIFIPNACNVMPMFDAEKDLTIWSGHWHKSRTCEKDRIFPALTEHKKLNYSIIDI
jgi:predicted phosphodiesterase